MNHDATHDCALCGEARSHVDAEGVCAWCRVAARLRENSGPVTELEVG